MKELKINIPEKRDLIRWKDIVWFKINGGFKCTKCGFKDNFNHVQFDSEVKGKRLMIENRTEGVCAQCTIDEINNKRDIVFTEQDCKCDWCGKQKDCTSFPRHEDLEATLLIGGGWWNGHHICQHCLNIGFDDRKPNHSNVHKYENGKHYQKNELGLWIEKK